MHLNDPFESAICNGITKAIHGGEFPKQAAIRTSLALNNMMFHQINQYGIVSLSETSRNLLMWAHYANEHSGVCIGYKEDFLDSLKKPEESNHSGHFKPIKVRYDNLRYDPSDNEEISITTPSERCFKILTTKSDEWIYEKEHRCIVPLYWADYIEYKGPLSDDIKFLILAAMADIYQDKDRYYIINDDDIDYGTTFKFSRDRNSLFIKNIQPEKIDRIYLGCRYPKESERKLLSLIKNKKHPMHHVKIYKYNIDPDRFELKEILLHPIIKSA